MGSPSSELGESWFPGMQAFMDEWELEHTTSFYSGEDRLLRRLSDKDLEILIRLLILPRAFALGPRHIFLKWLETQKRTISTLPDILRRSTGLHDSIKKAMGYEKPKRFSLCSWHKELDGRLTYAIKMLIKRETTFRCRIFKEWSSRLDLTSLTTTTLELINCIAELVDDGSPDPNAMTAKERQARNAISVLQACVGCDACSVAQVGGSSRAMIAALQASILARNKYELECKGKKRGSRLLPVTHAWLRVHCDEGRYADLAKVFARELYNTRLLIKEAQGLGTSECMPISPILTSNSAGADQWSQGAGGSWARRYENGPETAESVTTSYGLSLPARSPLTFDGFWPKAADDHRLARTFRPWRPSPESVQSTDGEGLAQGRSNNNMNNDYATVTQLQEIKGPLYPGQWVYTPSTLPPLAPKPPPPLVSDTTNHSPMAQQQPQPSLPSVSAQRELRRRPGTRDLQCEMPGVGKQCDGEFVDTQTRSKAVSNEKPSIVKRKAVPSMTAPPLPTFVVRQENEGFHENGEENDARAASQQSLPVRIVPQESVCLQAPKLNRRPVPLHGQKEPATEKSATMDASTPLINRIVDTDLVPKPLISRTPSRSCTQSTPPSTTRTHRRSMANGDLNSDSGDAIVSKLLVLTDEELRGWKGHFNGKAGLRPLSLVENFDGWK